MVYNDRIMTKRFSFLVAVHAFFIKDEQILLLKRANTGYMDGHFSVPAGHVDGGESIWKAMQREIKEEVDIEIKKTHQPIHVMHRTDKSKGEERIDYFFLIKDWKGLTKIGEIEKCSELEWFKLWKLPENIIPYVKFALQKMQEGVLFSEFEE